MKIDQIMKDFLFLKCKDGIHIKVHDFKEGFNKFAGDLFSISEIEKSLIRLGRIEKAIWVDGIRCYPNIQFKKENPTVRYNSRGFFEKIED